MLAKDGLVSQGESDRQRRLFVIAPALPRYGERRTARRLLHARIESRLHPRVVSLPDAAVQENNAGKTFATKSTNPCPIMLATRSRRHR